MKIKMIAICRKDKIYKNNTAPIHIRFTLNRQIRYISTGFSISPDDWDYDNGRIKTPLLRLKGTQHQIDKVIYEYGRKIKRLEALEVEVTFDTLFETNGRKATVTVVMSFRARCGLKENRKRKAFYHTDEKSTV